MQLDLVTLRSGFVSGAFGPLAVTSWREAPTRDHAVIVGELLTRLAREHERLLLLGVIGPECPPPEGAVREALAAEVRRLSSRIAASANLVEGTGFRAAALRGALAGMMLLVRPPYPQRVCATIEEAAGHLAPHSGGRLTASQIVTAAAELRAR